MREADGRSHAAALFAAIADQELLLVLDNLEQVLAAAPGSPHCSSPAPA